MVIDNCWDSKLAALLLILGSSSDVLSQKDFYTVYESVFPARSRYYNFGLNLGLDIATLESIKHSMRDQSEKDLAEVLNTWMKSKTHPSWKDVADALKAPSVGVDVTISP